MTLVTPEEIKTLSLRLVEWQGRKYPYTKLMSLLNIIHSAWFLGLFLQALLIGVLVIRKTWGKFPIFACYTAVNLVESLVAWAVYKNQTAYRITYVVGESVLLILGLALVREIFTHLFSAHAGLRKVATLIFRVVVVILVLLAAGALTYAKGPITQNMLIVEEAGKIIRVGLIMLLFLFSSAFGLRWRQHVFGVALGLGMTTVGSLLAVTIVPHVSSAMAWKLDLAQVVAFDLALLVWMGYLIAPEPVRSSADVPKRAQLEQWNQAVMELISR